MKHLSKHYRLAEKEFLKLAEEFRKMIELEKKEKRHIHPEIEASMDTLTKMVETIESHVGNRIQKEEKRQEALEEDRKNAQAECPRCSNKVPVIITGEIKIPKTGFTHYLVKCKTCKKEFMDPVPISDEDALQWNLNLQQQLQTIQPDGRPLWQCANIPEADIIDLEMKFRDYKNTVEKERKAFKEQEEAQAKIDSMIIEMRDELLVLRLKLQNWSGGDAIA